MKDWQFWGIMTVLFCILLTVTGITFMAFIYSCCIAVCLYKLVQTQGLE